MGKKPLNMQIKPHILNHDTLKWISLSFNILINKIDMKMHELMSPVAQIRLHVEYVDSFL